MKAILVAAVAALTVTLSADELKVNGDFKGSKLNAVQPVGWTKNFAKHKDIGVSKVVAGKKAGEFALTVKTTKRDTPFYTAGKYKVNAGDTLKMEADVKGSGKFMFAYYAYDAKGAYIGGKNGKIQTIGAGGEFKDKMEITPIKNKVLNHIRLVFTTLPNSDVTIKDIEAEIVPPVKK